VIAAAGVTADQVAFVVRHTTGILCAPMPAARAEALRLPQMVADNTDAHGTAFTVTVDHVDSGTGVAAADRAGRRRPRAVPAGHGRLVEHVATARMPTVFGDFRAVTYRSTLDGTEHLAIVLGDVADGVSDRGAPVRVHSECLTGDILGSLHCDCGAQLEQAPRVIADEGRGSRARLSPS
jgi:hypothetical protein